jgi:beta-glucosidase
VRRRWRRPQGHGLSYTTFKYSALKVSGRTISVEVANVGKVAGAEIPQLYLGYPAEAGEPRQVLRGFTTLTLQPGAKDTATFELEPQDTSIFDSAAGDWKQVKGEYKIGVGASSRDIRLTATAKL